MRHRTLIPFEILSYQRGGILSFFSFDGGGGGLFGNSVEIDLGPDMELDNNNLLSLCTTPLKLNTDANSF